MWRSAPRAEQRRGTAVTAARSLMTAVLASALAVPCVAEAAPPRHVAPSLRAVTTSTTPVKSDESVQAAIQRTPTGGVAYLPQGAFRTKVVIERPMTLVAHSRGTTFDGGNLGGAVVTIAPGVTDVRIEGLVVRNASEEGIFADAATERLSLSRVTVASCGTDGIRLVGAIGARLDLCVLEDNTGDGIDAEGSGLWATRVTAQRNGGSAVVVRGMGARVSDLVVVGGRTGLLVEGSASVLERCRFVGAGTAVRFGEGSWGNRLANSYVQGGGTAIEATAGSRSATIVDVVAQGLAGDAIRLAGSSHVLQDCDVSGGGANALVLSGTGSSVEGCRVLDVLGEGLRLEGDGHIAAGNRIEAAATEGIHVAWGLGNEVTGNVVLRCGGRGIADDGIDTLMSRNRID